jgi:hypothetical protein
MLTYHCTVQTLKTFGSHGQEVYLLDHKGPVRVTPDHDTTNGMVFVDVTGNVYTLLNSETVFVA